MTLHLGYTTVLNYENVSPPRRTFFFCHIKYKYFMLTTLKVVCMYFGPFFMAHHRVQLKYVNGYFPVAIPKITVIIILPWESHG